MSSQPQVVYKVVFRHQHKLFSSCKLVSNNDGRRAALRYMIGRPTVPKFGKLFAFASLAEALRYGVQSELFAVYKAAAIGCRPASMEWIPAPTFLVAMKEYWRGDCPYNWNVLTPPGTVFCDSITLIEKVY